MPDEGVKTRLRKLRALVIDEASARGLRCEEIPSDERGYYRYRRRLLIEDHRCQVIPSRVFYADSPSSKQHKVFHLCLPRTRWADFLICAVEDNETPNISFFVIPRGDVVKSTSLCSPDSWVFKYKDDWSLFSEHLPTERFERRVQKFQLETQIHKRTREKFRT
jgi:hypothetical protein